VSRWSARRQIIVFILAGLLFGCIMSLFYTVVAPRFFVPLPTPRATVVNR